MWAIHYNEHVRFNNTGAYYYTLARVYRIPISKHSIWPYTNVYYLNNGCKLHHAIVNILTVPRKRRQDYKFGWRYVFY